jgi:hypothetical protein
MHSVLQTFSRSDAGGGGSGGSGGGGSGGSGGGGGTIHCPLSETKLAWMIFDLIHLRLRLCIGDKLAHLPLVPECTKAQHLWKTDKQKAR